MGFCHSANDVNSFADADGFIPEEIPMAAEPEIVYRNTHTREKLDSFISDYNEMFSSAYSTKDSQSFYNYYNDINKKVKERKIDILLVVNMFLTGFDSPSLNTLYVDKNLRYHGLIQSYSRTNRIINELKSQGNIVTFRNLKANTDEAITLFSNKDAIEEIIMKPYDDYVRAFNDAYNKLLITTPTVDSVNYLETEDDELEFIKAFRDLMRIKNILTSFSDFKWDNVYMDEQSFEDYKSKYLDLHDKVKSSHETDKVSILEDVDFELELIHRDEINVSYIIQLLIKLKANQKKEAEQVEKEIANLLNTEKQLRSKKELIEKFIRENLEGIDNTDDIPQEFEKYWNIEQDKAFIQLVKEENLSKQRTQALIEHFLYSEKEPMREEILDLLEGEKPTLLQRKPIANKILMKILEFVDTFINGVTGS